MAFRRCGVLAVAVIEDAIGVGERVSDPVWLGAPAVRDALSEGLRDPGEVDAPPPWMWTLAQYGHRICRGQTTGSSTPCALVRPMTGATGAVTTHAPCCGGAHTSDHDGPRACGMACRKELAVHSGGC